MLLAEFLINTEAIVAYLILEGRVDEARLGIFAFQTIFNHMPNAQFSTCMHIYTYVFLLSCNVMKIAQNLGIPLNLKGPLEPRPFIRLQISNIFVCSEAI